MMTGINVLHVPYRGGGASSYQFNRRTGTSLLRSLTYVGKARALAVTSTMRSDSLPDIPPMSDVLPGFKSISWFSVGATKNTLAEIIQQLNTEINLGVADPKIKARFTDLGATIMPGSPSDLGKLIADETEKWAKVVNF